MGLFSKEPHPLEKLKALECLTIWNQTIKSIDEVTDAMRGVIATHSLGMQSDEFEEARLVAVNTVQGAQKETSELKNWPFLNDNEGMEILIQLVSDLEESYKHQMNLLNLYKIGAQAFKNGDDSAAPSGEEMQEANEAFGRLLDKMGHTAGKLARHYKISAREYLRS